MLISRLVSLNKGEYGAPGGLAPAGSSAGWNPRLKAVPPVSARRINRSCSVLGSDFDRNPQALDRIEEIKVVSSGAS